PDIAYHQNKFLRGFDTVVNIWGPDHHGYIPRLTAAVEALGQPPDALKVLIVQLATLYRNGQPVSMSTRRGQYISLQEVMDEVGVDAARFFFLMRSIKAHLDFDLELAKKETPENPVYYIQYAHARIHSIVAKALDINLEARTQGFRALEQEEEQALMKTIGRFADILRICCQQWDVFALVSYLLELATAFHRFYDKYRVVDVEVPELSSERLALIVATRIVLANGLRLVGVSAPTRM
ncbi:MAG TPA: DALR anticodon-binding domain-containing protein, partial [Candidatus Omnitrophota bacterium]|nr:DALR anticodon-binding domain-containing protein [Candidatus Omnitrophota bacterium]